MWIITAGGVRSWWVYYGWRVLYLVRQYTPDWHGGFMGLCGVSFVASHVETH